MDGSTTLLRVSLAEDNSLALLSIVSSKVAVKGTAVVTRAEGSGKKLEVIRKK